MRSKGYLIDSDTLMKWVLRGRSSPPILRLEDISPDIVPYACFPAAPDVYGTLRFMADEIARTQSQVEGFLWWDKMEREAKILLNDILNIRYATEEMCKRWMILAAMNPLHENANREHIWMIVCAQQLRDSRCDVTMAAEEPHIYQSYKDAGFLDEIEILQRA